MFLKNKNIIFEIGRSKVTDDAALKETPRLSTDSISLPSKIVYYLYYDFTVQFLTETTLTLHKKTKHVELAPRL